MLGFFLAEALRDFRRAGRVAAAAVVLIALSFGTVGGFWLLSANLGRVVAEWRGRVRVVVYLKSEPREDDLAKLIQRVRALPGVAAVAFVSKADALASLREVLGKDAGVVDHLPANPLPASLEVTPAAAGVTPEGARLLVERLAGLPEVDEVAGGGDWVERLEHWRRLLTTAGVGVGATLAVVAILAVTTSTTLVLHARRHETEIMRLVGAPESAVRLPLLLQGMLQGFLGALVGLLCLAGAHHLATPRIDPLLGVTLGLRGLDFLPPPALAALTLAGGLLGGFGGWLARGRREP